MRGPAHEIGHVHAAFEKRGLPAAERTVDVRQADIVGAAVVAGENDQRVLIKAFILQRLQQAADIAVEVAHHAAVDAQAVVGNGGKGGVILRRGLQRRVRGVGGEIEEKRAVAVGVNGGHRFIGEVVGHVFRGREPGRAVVLHAPGQRGPEEHVDRVPGLSGIFHARIVLRQIHRGAGDEAEAFVETLIFRPAAGDAAEMPFAEMQRVVALAAQEIGHGDFAGGDGFLIQRGDVFHRVVVEDGRMQGIGLLADAGD